jgi:putative spermidine/putrescine transport system permease protein
VLADPQTHSLKARLRRVERVRKLRAVALIAPLFLFLLITFVIPIGSMMGLSVENPEVASVLPRTADAIVDWDGIGIPDEDVLAAFMADLSDGREARTLGRAAKRLNYEISGFRSLLLKTARKLPAAPIESRAAALIDIDERWAEPIYWAAIKRASPAYTDSYLLAALDRTRNLEGEITLAPENQRMYVDVIGRTFWISLVVMLVCLVLGFPLAYLLASLPTSRSNLLLILVLLPFWTSLLVRTTAWVVLLQSQGVVNDLAMFIGLWSERVQLIHNRTGVYIAMVHILLPFMVLPIYSVMKGISPTHMKAAASLGAGPVRAFFKVYLPQTTPGVGAGCLLVFILSLGYYITPALVGGPKDQMLSYFIAFFTNETLNWGMAAALSVILLALALALFGVYNRLVGIDRLRMN